MKNAWRAAPCTIRNAASRAVVREIPKHARVDVQRVHLDRMRASHEASVEGDMKASERSAASSERRQRHGGIDWKRFWIRMILAAVAFNVLAALVTWLVIFPRLHPPP
jgi:hypothetical protein